MKAFLATSLQLLSLSASAFEFETGQYRLPQRVTDLIHAKVESVCFSDVHYIRSLELISYHLSTVRIDQGYKENQYRLLFQAKLTTGELARQLVSITVIDQLEDRSGELQTYDLDFQTGLCQ